jgi:hypothetical protein
MGRKRKERKQIVCEHYRHGLGEVVVLCSATPNGCRNTQHPTWRNYKRSFSVEIRWLGGRGLHTTRSITQIFVGGVLARCLVSSV